MRGYRWFSRRGIGGDEETDAGTINITEAPLLRLAEKPERALVAANIKAVAELTFRAGA